MKKTLSIIALCLAITLCIPSVPCLAFDGFNIKTQSSVSGFWSDQLDDNIQKSICSCPDDMVDRVYNALGTLTRTEDLPNYLLFLSYNSSNSVGQQYGLVLYTWDTDYDLFFYLSTSAQSGVTSGGKRLVRSKVTASEGNVVRFKQYNCNFIDGDSVPTWINGSVFSSNSGTNCYYSNLFSGSVLDGNCKALAYDNLVANNISISSGMGSSQANTVWSNKDNSSLTNYLSDLLPYENSDGDIITPVQVESNSNHMYFNSCDFGFCEPKGISSYNQFGGAYIYCRYVVDDWVVNHISDYSLQISMETLLDNQRYFRTLNYPLDRDGCLTLPFKNFGLTGADNITQGFVVVGNNNQTIDTDYFKVNLYSITTEQSKQEWFENAARTYNTVKAIDIYDTYDFDDVQDFYESNVAKYNKFTINLRAVLVSGNDNSGPVARSFNLVTGSDIATDTSGYDNENPFVPDDSIEDYTPSLPSDNNTTVPSIVINTGGTWQGTFNGKIGYDPGYTDLKLDVNKDPDGNFTQYLNPMKNQSFGSWFFSFLDDMPGEMKALLIAGTGVGIFFGLYRFIRRG